MDPQQIIKALNMYRPFADPGERLKVIRQAAAEYADLLETSEQVWWCDMCLSLSPEQETRRQHCLDDSPDSKHSQVYNSGWRLLTPTERQET